MSEKLSDGHAFKAAIRVVEVMHYPSIARRLSMLTYYLMLGHRSVSLGQRTETEQMGLHHARTVCVQMCLCVCTYESIKCNWIAKVI